MLQKWCPCSDNFVTRLKQRGAAVPQIDLLHQEPIIRDKSASNPWWPGQVDLLLQNKLGVAVRLVCDRQLEPLCNWSSPIGQAGLQPGAAVTLMTFDTDTIEAVASADAWLPASMRSTSTTQGQQEQQVGRFRVDVSRGIVQDWLIAPPAAASLKQGRLPPQSVAETDSAAADDDDDDDDDDDAHARDENSHKNHDDEDTEQSDKLSAESSRTTEDVHSRGKTKRLSARRRQRKVEAHENSCSRKDFVEVAPGKCEEVAWDSVKGWPRAERTEKRADGLYRSAMMLQKVQNVRMRTCVELYMPVLCARLLLLSDVLLCMYICTSWYII